MHYFPGRMLSVDESDSVITRLYDEGARELRALQIPHGICVDLHYEGHKLVKCYRAGCTFDNLIAHCDIAGIAKEIAVPKAILRGYITIKRSVYDNNYELFGPRIDDINSIIEKAFTWYTLSSIRQNLEFLLDVIYVNYEDKDIASEAKHLIRKDFISCASTRSYLSDRFLMEYRTLLRRSLNIISSSLYLVDMIRITTDGDMSNPESYFSITTHANVRILTIDKIISKLGTGGRISTHVIFREKNKLGVIETCNPDPNLLRSLDIKHQGTTVCVGTASSINNIIRVRHHNTSGVEYDLDVAKCPSCNVETSRVGTQLYCLNKRCTSQIIRALKYYFHYSMLDRNFDHYRIINVCDYIAKSKELLPISLFDEGIKDIDSDMYEFIQSNRKIPLDIAVSMLQIRGIDRTLARHVSQDNTTIQEALACVMVSGHARARMHVNEYLDSPFGKSTIEKLEQIRGV